MLGKHHSLLTSALVRKLLFFVLLCLGLILKDTGNSFCYIKIFRNSQISEQTHGFSPIKCLSKVLITVLLKLIIVYGFFLGSLLEGAIVEGKPVSCSSMKGSGYSSTSIP